MKATTQENENHGGVLNARVPQPKSTYKATLRAERLNSIEQVYAFNEELRLRPAQVDPRWLDSIKDEKKTIEVPMKAIPAQAATVKKNESLKSSLSGTRRSLSTMAPP